jgi:hypothetical protein
MPLLASFFYECIASRLWVSYAAYAVILTYFTIATIAALTVILLLCVYSAPIMSIYKKMNDNINCSWLCRKNS